jgi:glycosyltransferase involved in cell wall biosynthesis
MSRSRLAGWYARIVMGLACRRAARVITDSGRTKDDLVKRGGPAEKVSVVWLGVDEAYRPAAEADRTDVLRRHNLAPGYILYVGNIRPIKNVPRLVEAYALLKRRRPDAPALVLAGRNQLGDSFASEAARAGARLLGEVPFADMSPLYSAAGLFAFPSLYEGFGLPPLEAMACGCPVVSSSEGSLREVLGDAAVFVDPYDASAIAAGLDRALADPALRADLARQGAAQAAKFTWRRTADETFRIYGEARGAR